MAHHLTGSFRIRVFGPALWESKRTWPRTKDRMLIRRQALKLRFFPEKHPTDGSGAVLDLDWSWVRALQGEKIGELRISDVIGGHDNIRVMFFVPSEKPPDGVMPTIWILAAFQKKRNEFTTAQIAVLRVRKKLLMERLIG